MILGAGASGLMAASHLKRGLDIVILEGNPKAGAKIESSGGGKCNITSAEVSSGDYRGDEAFISSVLRHFDNRALLNWLKRRGLNPIMRKDSQYFCPHSAKEMISLLLKSKGDTPIHYSTKIDRVSKENDNFAVYTDRGIYRSKKLILALGGMAYPRVGATDKGIEIAKSFNHTINTTYPALTGFTLQKEQFFMKELSGISMRVLVKVADKEILSDMLFAHRGISGPAILDASLWWQKGEIEIDFLPNFEINSIKSSKKLLSTALPLPRRASKALIEAVGVEERACNRLKKEEWYRVERLRAYRFAPAGRFGYARAEVMAGGVDIAEIYKESMESKLVSGLYILGELLDVTGRVGGFNFQWAFATAKVCSDSLNREYQL